jgi:hypothetical protein
MGARFILAVIVMILAASGVVASVWHGWLFTAACSALVFVVALVDAFRWAMALTLVGK